MPTAEPKYNRLYWDSNIFIRKTWPEVSAALMQTLGLAKTVDVQSVFLGPVEKELKQHWEREFRKQMGRLSNVREFLARVGLNVSGTVPCLEEALIAYQKTVDHVVSTHNLIRRAPPLRDLETVFEMAIRQTRPFGEQGRNFQDCVILLAAIDDLKNSGAQRGIFVSDDDAFDQDTLNVHSQPLRLELKMLKSVDEVSAELRSYLFEAYERAWKERDELAKLAVKEILPRVQEYLSANLQISETDAISGLIQSVSALRVVDVQKVLTPNPASFSDGDRLTITAELLLDIRAKILSVQSVFPPPRLLKVGEEASQYLTFKTFSSRALIDEEFPKTVRMELNATFAQGKFVDVEPASILTDKGAAFYGGLLEPESQRE